jgi:small subunit ribosomal protein S6
VHRRVPKHTKYEFTLILDPLLDDAAVAASLEKYAKIVRDQGGEIAHQEIWGRKRLAYEIRHKVEGSYAFLRMQATPAVVSELNRVLHFDEGVLRSLIVVDEEWEARNLEAAKLAGAKPEAAAPASAS